MASAWCEFNRTSDELREHIKTLLRGYEPETARIWETKPHAAASKWVPCVIMVNGAVRALEDNATYTGVKRESLRMRIVNPLALDGRVSKMRLAAIAKLASALTDNFVHGRSEDFILSAPPTHLSFEEAVLLAPLIRHALVNAAARVTAVPFEERVAMTLNDRRLLQWRWFLRFLNASYAPELCLRRDSGHALAACLLRDAEAGLILHVQVGTPANTYESLLERLAETVGFDRPTIGLLCRAVGCRCISFKPLLRAAVPVAELREFLPCFRVAIATANPHGRFDRDLVHHIQHLEILQGDEHAPPTGGGTLAPLTAWPRPDTACPLLDALQGLGPDALEMLVLRRVSLRAKRALACAAVGFARAIGAHLRAEALHLLEEDATLENALFVARLPDARYLHVENDVWMPRLDVRLVRASRNLALRRMSTATALFMGCLVMEGEHTVRLQNGVTRVALQNLRTMPVVNLCVTSHTDVAVLLGSLASNRNLAQIELPKRYIQLSAIVPELGRALHARNLTRSPLAKRASLEWSRRHS